MRVKVENLKYRSGVEVIFELNFNLTNPRPVQRRTLDATEVETCNYTAISS